MSRVFYSFVGFDVVMYAAHRAYGGEEIIAFYEHVALMLNSVGVLFVGMFQSSLMIGGSLMDLDLCWEESTINA